MKTLAKTFGVLTLAFVTAGTAFAEKIKWAATVSPEAHHRATNVPDFRSPPGAGHTISNFGPVRIYGRLGMLSPGLSTITFRRGYFLAFENNGGSGAGVTGGWESSIWGFADSRGSFTYRWNETKAVAANNTFNGAAGVLSSGPISSPTYGRFFGMCCSGGPWAISSSM